MVTLHEHRDAGGWVLEIHEATEVAQVARMGLRYNDSISSVTLQPGTSVTLFQHDDFRGRTITFTNTSNQARMYNLREAWHNFCDITSSFRVSIGPVVNAPHFNGRTFTIISDVRLSHVLDWAVSKGTTVLWSRHTQPSTNQQWRLELDRTTNTYTIRTQHSSGWGHALSDSNGRTQMTSATTSRKARWRVVPVPGRPDLFSIVNVGTGRALNLMGVPTQLPGNGMRINTATSNNTSRQHWRFTELGTVLLSTEAN
jgi:hypothetical protein